MTALPGRGLGRSAGHSGREEQRERGRAGCPPADPLPPAPQETYKLPHRLIEKKRRDRINECIAQLKDLLPEHLKLTVGASGGRRDGAAALCCRFTADLG